MNLLSRLLLLCLMSGCLANANARRLSAPGVETDTVVAVEALQDSLAALEQAYAACDKAALNDSIIRLKADSLTYGKAAYTADSLYNDKKMQIARVEQQLKAMKPMCDLLSRYVADSLQALFQQPLSEMDAARLDTAALLCSVSADEAVAEKSAHALGVQTIKRLYDKMVEKIGGNSTPADYESFNEQLRQNLTILRSVATPAQVDELRTLIRSLREKVKQKQTP